MCPWSRWAHQCHRKLSEAGIFSFTSGPWLVRARFGEIHAWSCLSHTRLVIKPEKNNFRSCTIIPTKRSLTLCSLAGPCLLTCIRLPQGQLWTFDHAIARVFLDAKYFVRKLSWFCEVLSFENYKLFGCNDVSSFENHTIAKTIFFSSQTPV